MNQTYDVLVVGGGIAGLTAAAYCAKTGLQTLVCERGQMTGGLVNSFSSRGYTFDAGIRALEDSGVILGYRALLAPSELGLNFSAMVFVTLREVTRQAIADFEAAVIETSQIVDAQRLFGDPDYLLHVVAADLPAFQQLYDERLTSLPNVQRLTSTLVMKRVIQDRMLPL